METQRARSSKKGRKDMKKTIITAVIAAAVLIGSATVALAADSWKTPAEILAAITGKTVEQVADARQEGATYGTQAAAAGKLEQFQDERLAQYKLRLDQAVKDGKLTQAKADELYQSMKARVDTCTGNGTGEGRGSGCGMGAGRGNGFGRGMGNGAGNGMGCIGR